MENRIRELRKQRRWSYDDVARRLSPVASGSTIQKLENGTMQLTLAWMERLAAAFEVQVTEILAPPAAGSQFNSSKIFYVNDVQCDNGQQGDKETSLVVPMRYTMKTRVIEDLGLVPGDVLDVASILSTRELATGDIIIAKTVPTNAEDPEYLIAREFIEPNLLITNARHDNAPSVHLATGAVRILGRVIGAHRSVTKAS